MVDHKNYVVVMGYFGRFLVAKHFFDPTQDTFAQWYEGFKVDYIFVLNNINATKLK